MIRRRAVAVRKHMPGCVTWQITKFARIGQAVHRNCGETRVYAVSINEKLFQNIVKFIALPSTPNSTQDGITWMNDLILSIQRTKYRFDNITHLLLPTCVFLVSFIFYFSLYSPLQIDDTWRYTDSVAASQFQWDASHLLMQPATVLWHMILGMGGDALTSQKTINSFSAAISFSIVFVLLRKLNVSLLFSITLVVIAAVSRYTLELGTSGHMKLTTAPWLAAALYHCVLWERAINNRSHKLSDYKGHLIYAGLFMAIGTAFLINTVIVLPFLAISMWVVLAQRKEKFGDIFTAGCIFSAVFLVVIIPIMGLGYLFALVDPNISSFSDFLFAKNEAWDKPLSSLPKAVGQTVLTTANNFVWLDKLLPVLRAWVSGDLIFDSGYFMLIVKEAIYVGVTLLILSATYALAIMASPKFQYPVLTPIAFTIGCLVFAIWWNYHEEEFYFQITVPTIVLMSCVCSTNARRWVISGWAIILITNNVFEHAIPKANYPLTSYEGKIRASFGENDLFVHFSTWPGRHDLTQLKLPKIPHWPIDEKLLNADNAKMVFELTQERIDKSLKQGGRVIVFRMLDERDWDAPWSQLPRRGVSKRVLAEFFSIRYRVIPIGELAQIKAWELKRL
jgi:hypothetical protein